MKKKAALIEAIKEKFFKSGKEIGTREEMLDYVWNVQIKRQLGYSFSLNHTMPYSCICIQGMNLAYKYNPIFWNCGCLCVNSGSSDDDSLDKGVDYGKVAKALGTINKAGQKIALPDINEAESGFDPNLKNNEIIFGMKSIQNVNNDIIKAIKKYRPYSSMLDFYNKMQEYKKEAPENKFGDTAMISLIKAGCFDKIENRNRAEIMKDFVCLISSPIASLKVSNIEDLNKLNLLTQGQKEYELRLFRFRRYVLNKKFLEDKSGKSANTEFYRLDHQFAEPFFLQHFESNMRENIDYRFTDDGMYCVKRGSLDREFNKLMENFKCNILSDKTMLEAVNKKKVKDLWIEKGLNTSISKWEMDSLSYYYSGHELDHVNKMMYNISNFNELSSDSKVCDWYYYRGQKKPRFELTRICGTVISKNKNKNIIVLLTPDGAVTVKFYKG